MRKKSIIPFILSTLILSSCGHDTNANNADDSAPTTTVTTTETTTTSETDTTTTSTGTTTLTTTETTTTTTDTYDTKTQELVEKVLSPDYEADDKATMAAVNDIVDPCVMSGSSHKFSGGTPNGMTEFYTLENYMIYEAESILDDRYLGAVTNEEDAVEKGRYVYHMGKGQDYIDWLEKEPAPQDGVDFTRDDPPYLADYYNDYDVWRVRRIPPSWTRNDGGSHIVSWSEGSSYLLIRGSDGKVLGTFINH